MAIRVISKAPKISTAEDVGRSAGTGAIEGAVSIPGAFGDIRGLGESLAGWVTEKMGRKGPAPKMSDMTPMPMRAFAGAVGKVGENMGLDPRIARVVTALIPGSGGIANAPTSAELIGALGKDKPLYQPQTKWGERARTGGQFAVAGLPTGAAVQRIARATIPAAASQAAGEATKGTPYEPWARVAAAVAGGVGTEMATNPGPRQHLLSEASRGASDQQIAEAAQLMAQAQRQGVRITMAEALQQVTDGATGMGRLQRVVEGTKAGNAHIAPVMAQRPAQTRAAIVNTGESIGARTSQPSAIGPRAQAAAQGSLDNIRQSINALARPHYDAAEGALIPAEQFQAIAADPAYARAAQEVLDDPILGAQLQARAPNDLAVVDAVVKQLDRNATASAQTVANPGGNNALASAFGNARTAADEAATAVSPEWREARDIGAQGRSALLEPVEAGPIGRIAATDDVRSQIGALYPPQPLAGGAAETASAAQTLNASNPSVLPALTRQHIVSSGMEATQDLQGGPNQWGGAGWVARQMGNEEQAAALGAGFRLSGGNPESLDNLVAALRATGWRERPGSLTAYNAKDIEELGRAGMVGEVARTGLNPPGVLRRLGEGFQNWQTERNAGRLAEAILANPAEAEAILLHARQVVPPGAALQAIERTALAARLAALPHGER